MSTTRRCSLAALTTALAIGLGPSPALAQDPDLPPPSPGGSDADQPGTIDFGESVIIDEDGNVRWTVPTDTSTAEGPAGEPTPAPEGGVSGTGEVSPGPGATEPETPADPTEPAGTNDPLNREDAAGTGNSLALILAIAGGAAVLVVAALFLVRLRRQRREELDVVEDPIDPLANERLAGEFPDPVVAEPAYAGATEAGAYEEGGAAYAQYADPAYAAGSLHELPAPGSSKLDQLRASMVSLADKGLADAGKDRLVAQKLEAAGSKMRPGEWLVMTIGGTLAGFFGASFVLGWLIGAFAAALTAIGFWMYLSAREGARQKAFAESLPETLQLIAGSLRGGLSMMQSIQTVADEADEPTAEEFQRIVTETRLGRDLSVSFRDLSDRMGSKDFEWVVTAIEIHREVGGDLAGILDRVSDTIRARNRVRGQVKALSAEGRVSGIILFILPPAMVGAISVLNREYLNEMLNETEGQIMLIIAGVLLLAGGAWLKRLARFVY